MDNQVWLNRVAGKKRLDHIIWYWIYIQKCNTCSVGRWVTEAFSTKATFVKIFFIRFFCTLPLLLLAGHTSSPALKLFIEPMLLCSKFSVMGYGIEYTVWVCTVLRSLRLWNVHNGMFSKHENPSSVCLTTEASGDCCWKYNNKRLNWELDSIPFWNWVRSPYLWPLQWLGIFNLVTFSVSVHWLAWNWCNF